MQPENTRTPSKNSEVDPRKLFVGGLHWSTNEEHLFNYMNVFGDLESVKVVYDNVTKRSRGFGFVKFMEEDSLERVLLSGPHVLNDKKIDPKRAQPMSRNNSSDGRKNSQCQDSSDGPVRVNKKIFVGGLKAEQSEEDVHCYFEKFGKVQNVKFYYHKNTGFRRGFCFVEFDAIETAQKVLENRFHTIENEIVEVKVAQRRPMKYPQGDYYGRFYTGSGFCYGTVFGQPGIINVPVIYYDNTALAYSGLCYPMPYYYNVNEVTFTESEPEKLQVRSAKVSRGNSVELSE